MKPTLQQLLCTMACCLSVAATAAPVFLEASVTAVAAAKVWIYDPLQSDQQSASFTQPAGSHRVSASVYASDPDFGMEMLASQDIEAVMNGEATGTVSMHYALIARDPVLGAMSLGETSGWRYRFRADADGVVRVHYQVLADPLVQNTSNDAAFSVQWTRLGSFAHGANLDADSNGMLSFALAAGEVYDFVIRAGGAFVPSVSNDFTRSFSGTFNWSIEDLPAVQAVPEPAGLLLVLTALAAAAALRGRRR